MKNRTSPRRRHVALLALAASCSGPVHETPRSTTTTVTAHASTARITAAVDTSEVAAPAGLVALVRIAAPAALAHRIGELAGVSALVEPVVDQLLRTAVHDRALAALVDRNAPVDIGLMVDARDDVKLVMSLSVPAADALEARLGSGHRLVAQSNGVYRLEAQATPGDGEDDTPVDEAAVHCVVAPTPRAGAARLVCGDDAGAIEASTAYFSRTLPRRPVAADAITADVMMDAVRSHFADDLGRLVDQQRARVDGEIARDTSGALAQGPAREAMTRLLNPLFDDLRDLLSDAVGASTSFTFGDESVTWRTSLDLRAAHGMVARATVASLAHQPAMPADLVTHLPAGALYYLAASTDSRPYQPLIALLQDVAVQVTQGTRGLTAADVTAVRAALDAMVVLDQVAMAQSAGIDEHGEVQLVEVVRSHELTTARVTTALRALVAALHRPAVARLVNARLRHLDPHAPDVHAVRELPARGLPAGAYGLELPSFSHTWLAIAHAMAPDVPLTGASHAASNAPVHRAPPSRLLVVPAGSDTLVAYGADAAGLVSRFQAATTPGIDAASLTLPTGGIAIAVVPAALPAAARAQNAPGAADLTAAVNALPDHGQTPVVMRMHADDVAGGATRVDFDVEIHRPTLQGVVRLLR